MLQLNFNSIAENLPGDKWQQLFNKHWPAYKAWFVSKGAVNSPSLKEAQQQLKEYMPKFIPTYNRLCELAGDDIIAHRFLTGYQPPAYISGCSQAVIKNPPQLVRNYDYHPNLCEGTLLNSAWNGKHVIAIGDCLWGVVDGMNSDGLVASLTFGGRKVVGKGFGIPFILRYVLEFCSTIEEASEVLQRIPSHMAYNIMLLDKDGNSKMLQLAPDHKPKVTDLKISTNHQGTVDWPEHAAFSKTVEREKFLQEALKSGNIEADALANKFLEKPLFNRQYNDGFGTIYTSVYRPSEGYMELRWEDKTLKQSFADFDEGNTLITYREKVWQPQTTTKTTVPKTSKDVEAPHYATADYWVEYGKSWASGNPTDLGKQVAELIGNAMGMAGTPQMDKMLKDFASETKKRGQVPWEMLADLWAGFGR
ncbi:putative choloylglycine hydrolase [Aequorivita sublithincola DSM 14238]|uniref:Putative choloylglycine hydrolase n=1 Tax=Aequorivita sublithincola (strain DSM 14238 / LMG 21431 / ACAM 643 / 9-3) TaxID=746697 RepID=I3YWQ6_AEQSU|nr:C45 family peptidase [Aequorivita sublithincola]AFL81424.1 putative choloylglycine hydrolase [Aequorivita sublithincola DSM 14238]